MKKNYIFKLFLLLIPLTSFILMSNSSGVSGAYSGSPGDSGNTCSVCHSGGNFSASVSITTNIPATGYEPNTDYDITVLLNQSGASRHGFALTAEKNADNSKVGTFTPTSTTRLVNGGANITQSDADSGSIWTFTWTSPSTNEGPVTFYAAGNAANGNGSPSGDQIVTSSLSAPSLGISEAKRLVFNMYPNPSSDLVQIELPTGTTEAEAGVFDYKGRRVNVKRISPNDNQLDVSDLAAGIYLIRISTDEKVGIQKLIKK